MPRRRNEDHLLDNALTYRWPYAATVAAGCALAAVVLPSLFAGELMFRALAPIFRGILEIGAVVFGVIAFIKWLSEFAKARRPEEALVRWRPATAPRTAPSDPRFVAFESASASPPARPEPHLRPTRWSLDLLQSIDWKRFEDVAAAYFREHSFRCVTQAFGADGGIDGTLYFADLPMPVGVFQCKAWGRRPVGVKEVRELLGVMTHRGVARGYFLATGTFTADAIQFAGTSPIKLICGEDLLTAIAQMDEVTQARLLALTTAGDYTTPSCASCGGKMVLKTLRGGKTAWGCPDYPRCRSKLIFTKAA